MLSPSARPCQSLAPLAGICSQQRGGLIHSDAPVSPVMPCLWGTRASRATQTGGGEGASAFSTVLGTRLKGSLPSRLSVIETETSGREFSPCDWRRRVTWPELPQASPGFTDSSHSAREKTIPVRPGQWQLPGRPHGNWNQSRWFCVPSGSHGRAQRGELLVQPGTAAGSGACTGCHGGGGADSPGGCARMHGMVPSKGATWLRCPQLGAHRPSPRMTVCAH